MYETKPTNINPQDLCILTKPKTNGVVNMYQKDQPICSESRLEALASVIDRLESIFIDFERASAVNSKINDIIYDENDTTFPGRDIFDVIDKLDDMVCSKIKRIKDLPGIYKMTKSEIANSCEEFSEPQNQSPFGAGNPSLSEIMEDI